MEETFELTERELKALADEEKALKARPAIYFYVTGHPDYGWHIEAGTEEERGMKGHTSFWLAYAQCAHMEYDQAEEEYGNRMSKVYQAPVYDYRDFIDPPKQYEAYQ